ncbi:MAG: NFACT RNA binding domain-containing protein [Pyrinomonadaceae bacterium]
MIDEPAKTPKGTEREARLAELAAKARRKVLNQIKKSIKLIENLNGDLEKHGNPEMWKRSGDLLLANLSTARRVGDKVSVTDYFDETTPIIEIEGDANSPISEIAESYFKRYVKARNAQGVLAERITAAEKLIEELRSKIVLIDAAASTGDEAYLVGLTSPKQKVSSRPKKKVELAFKGARRFASSDGFEILVGKKAADNDFLTFRVAKSLDLWLHAADYPGSHVVVRIQGRKAVPDRTLLEAAQLAAFYSDAREHPKAAVKYTQKKFVNKPKRSVPGLVSLSKFKTILVEPQIVVEMIREEI